MFHLQFATAEEVTLADIRATLDRYTRDIETLTGRQRTAFQTRKPVSRLRGGSLVMEDLTIETDFKIDFVHRRTSLAGTKTWYYREISNDPFAVDELTMFDGEVGFDLSRTLKQVPIPSKMPLNAPFRLGISRTDGTQGSQSVIRLAGLPICGALVSLAAALSAPDTKIIGQQIIDNQRCVNVEVIIGSYHIEASLDPAVSFLPRRLAVIDPVDKTQRIFDQSVSEFRQFPNAGSNESFWFPVRGREVHTGTTTVDLELLALTINPPLTIAESQIDPATLPPGVRIDKDGKMEFTGDRKDLWQELDRLDTEESQTMDAIIDKARIGNPTVPTMPVRVPQRSDSGSNSMALVIGLVSLILLLVGLRLRWKQR